MGTTATSTACSAVASPTRADRVRVAALAALLLAAPGPVGAQFATVAAESVAASPSAMALQRLLAAGPLPGMSRPDVSDVRASMRELYGANAWEVRWIADGRPTPALRAVVQRFLAAGAHGLEPADYDAASHDSTLARLEAGGVLPPEELVAFDAQVSASALRYVAAMRHGRVRLSWREDSLMLRRPAGDVVPLVDSVLRAPEPALLLTRLDARGAGYPRLQAALVRARQMAADSTLILPRLVAPVRPGARMEEAAELRRYLVSLGDLPDTFPTPGPEADTLYDATLVARVKAFQRVEGVTADGVLGKGTLERLADARRWRARQVELALERWRTMADPPESTYIWVNIPEFRMHVREPTLAGWRDVLSMNVVVGRRGRNETPELDEEMEAVVFRPYWNVTPRIMRDEILPKAATDSTYLAKESMELVQNGKVIPATPENVASIGKNGVRVRQIPGAQNALGTMKFLLPNDLGIYLHDTPTRSSFSRERRAESHGCVRLADAKALALWLLRDVPQWPEARIDSAVAGRKPVEAKLPAPVPIRVTYATVIANEDSTLQRFPDVYGRDRTLDRVLRSGYPYPGRLTAVRSILKP
jgi:murein L,D-transpeptidase YcbB/YkuD